MATTTTTTVTTDNGPGLPHTSTVTATADLGAGGPIIPSKGRLYVIPFYMHPRLGF